jgi:hypothetical protein
VSDGQRTIEALQQFARSRGGECLSSESQGEGVKHAWRCGRGHEFEASPRLLISGGYWCTACFPRIDDTSGWDYDRQSQVDPLLAKFYTPAS